MTRKQATIVVAFAVVVLVGVVVGTLTRQNGPSSPISGNNPVNSSSSTNSGDNGNYSANVPQGAIQTKPTTEIPITNSSAGGNVKTYKVLSVAVNAGGFDPSSITVKKGDVVEFDLTASGGSFDMFSQSAGFYASAAANQTGKVTFTPSAPGTYSFSCRDLCPAGRTISGELIVLP